MFIRIVSPVPDVESGIYFARDNDGCRFRTGFRSEKNMHRSSHVSSLRIERGIRIRSDFPYPAFGIQKEKRSFGIHYSYVDAGHDPVSHFFKAVHRNLLV